MHGIPIEGPYRHGKKWRCRLVIAGRRMWCRPSAPSKEDALQVAEGAAKEAQRNGSLTVREAMALYEQDQREKGNRPETMRHWRIVLLRFFEGQEDHQLAQLTASRCAGLYERLRTEKSQRTSKPLSVDSHRGYLSTAKAFLSFCVEAGFLKAHPLGAVKGVGRRRKGKAQHRVDEARRFYAVALERATMGDSGSAAALVGLLMGFRPGETISRTARDLDDGGRILWVDDTETFEKKTESSRRAVQVPTALRPILRELARDKVGNALLFTTRDGKPHSGCWVNRHVARLCELAGVPRVCAHALRGMQATTALHAGATPELVASVLGHESPDMTLRHYAARGSAQASEQIARVLVLDNGRK